VHTSACALQPRLVPGWRSFGVGVWLDGPARVLIQQRMLPDKVQHVVGEYRKRQHQVVGVEFSRRRAFQSVSAKPRDVRWLSMASKLLWISPYLAMAPDSMGLGAAARSAFQAIAVSPISRRAPRNPLESSTLPPEPRP
jgi:hypothetical protein